MLNAKKKSAGLILAALASLGLSFGAAAGTGVSSDTEAVDRIITTAKNDNRAMQLLAHLTQVIGSRPVGSKNFLRACKWAHSEFQNFGLKNVRLEPCGEIKGALPDRESSAFFEQYYPETFGKKAGQEMAPIFNVIADIPGTEWPDEVVIVGAHLDSAPQGPGATDNGAGVAAVMEAARQLAASGVKPRRTVRFILFGGEEAGLVGSKGYVEAHKELIPKISAVYNMDHGANFISGIVATEPMLKDMQKIFSAAMRLDPDMPFAIEEVDYLPAADPNCCASMARKLIDEPGMRRVVVGEDGKEESGCGALGGTAMGQGTTIKKVTENGDTVVMKIIVPGAPGAEGEIDLENLDPEALGISPKILEAGGDSLITRAVVMGSSDHAPFLAEGIPAFWWTQEENDVVPYNAHSKEDTYDKVNARYLNHSSTVIALGALGTANLDHMLSREKLTAP